MGNRERQGQCNIVTVAISRTVLQPCGCGLMCRLRFNVAVLASAYDYKLAVVS